MAKKFYVYEHWRPDRGECFYVGKGHGNRANVMQKRNMHHTAIQRKLSSLGLCVEVKIIAKCLDEEDAFSLEKERIAFWRSDGADLANYTNGGDGTSGYYPPIEVRQKMNVTRKGKKHSPAHREKLASHLRRIGEDKTIQDRRKRSVVAALASPETRKKLSDARKRQVFSEDTRASMRKAWTDERRAALADRNKKRAEAKRAEALDAGDK